MEFKYDLDGLSAPLNSEEKLKSTQKKMEYKESFNRRLIHDEKFGIIARKEANILKEKLTMKLEKNASESKVYFEKEPDGIGSNIPKVTLKVRFHDLTIHLHSNQEYNLLFDSSLEINIYKKGGKIQSYKKKFYISDNEIHGWRDFYNEDFLPTDAFIGLVFHDIVEIISQ